TVSLAGDASIAPCAGPSGDAATCEAGDALTGGGAAWRSVVLPGSRGDCGTGSAAVAGSARGRGGGAVWRAVFRGSFSIGTDSRITSSPRSTWARFRRGTGAVAGSASETGSACAACETAVAPAAAFVSAAAIVSAAAVVSTAAVGSAV